MSGLYTAEPDALPAPPDSGPGLFGDLAPASASLAGPPGLAPPPSAARAVPYRVLARKYRPTGFADLIGQDVMVRTLRNAFALNRIAHAFMLTGVRGVGKTTTARIIARALNCIGPDGSGGPTADPCGVCANCTAILADRHPDVVEMDAATRNKVDDAREIIEAVRYKPMQARTKVFILDEVHMLTTQAFNALLKTLEEPPPHITFIFATTEIRKVPITVLSRCQRFDLRRISAAELGGLFARVAAAEGVAVAPAALELIARAADGSARDGLSLLDQAIARMDGAEVSAPEVADMLGLADRAVVFDLMDALMAGDVAGALAVTDRAHAFGADLGMILGDLLDLVHSLTRLRAAPELQDGPLLPEMERTRGAALADRLSVPVLARAWQMLLKGVAEVDAAPDRRAAAEMVLIRLCHVADLPPPGELVRLLAAGVEAEPGAPGPPGGGTPSLSSGRAPAPSGRSVLAPPGISTPAPVDRSASALVNGSAPAPVNGSAPVPLEKSAPPPDRNASMPMNRGAPALDGAASASSGGNAPASPDGGGRVRAVANGAPMTDAAPAPRLASYRDVVALVAGREPTLHGYLRNAVHPVRFAPGVIELRPEPDAPRDLAANLARVLQEATGERWTIALSKADGEPTLDQQAHTADTARRHAAADHPLVRAILDAFPGAVLGAVQDHTADAYGLPPEVGLGYGSPEVGLGYGSPEVGLGYGSPEVGLGYGSPEVGLGYGSPEVGLGYAPDVALGEACAEAEPAGFMSADFIPDDWEDDR